MCGRQFDPIRREVLEELWAGPRCGEMSDDIAGSVGSLLYEAKYLMHSDHFALHAVDLIDADQSAPAIGKPLQLHDDGNRRSNLATDARDRQSHPGHRDHLLKTLERIARRIGMYRRHRTFMTGIHRLHHIEGLFAAALADNDAIGSHAQCILYEVALAYFSFSLNVGRSGFEPSDVQLLKLQFSGVFNGNKTLFAWNEVRQGI